MTAKEQLAEAGTGRMQELHLIPEKGIACVHIIKG
jgi:hypothetical protein